LTGWAVVDLVATSHCPRVSTTTHCGEGPAPVDDQWRLSQKSRDAAGLCAMSGTGDEDFSVAVARVGLVATDG